jgi:hypothetical protein
MPALAFVLLTVVILIQCWEIRHLQKQVGRISRLIAADLITLSPLE